VLLEEHDPVWVELRDLFIADVCTYLYSVCPLNVSGLEAFVPLLLFRTIPIPVFFFSSLLKPCSSTSGLFIMPSHHGSSFRGLTD
jgi:hypothetical protein